MRVYLLCARKVLPTFLFVSSKRISQILVNKDAFRALFSFRRLTGIFFIATTLFLCACGKDDTASLPEPDHSIALYYDEAATVKEEDFLSANLDKPPLDILWGANYETIGFSVHWRDSIRGNVLEVLSEKFNVRLSGVYIPDYYEAEAGLRASLAAAGKTQAKIDEVMRKQGIPAIFYENPEQVHEANLTRTIPRAMIETHAPNYAALLTREGGWDLFRTENDEYLGLATYNAYHDQLNIFSVYRLDWLEELGISPRGNPVPISDRVYFSTDAFSAEEFSNIISHFIVEGLVNNNAASSTGYWTHTYPMSMYWTTNQNYGAEVTMGGIHGHLYDVAAILGMWGVHDGIMEEDGKPIPYFISLPYQEALQFMAGLNPSRNAFTVFPGYGTKILHHYNFKNNRRHGWANIHIDQLFPTINELLQREKNAKILITPPEINTDGRQGVGITALSRPFDHNRGWVISKDTGDETLARVLEIYDAMSFDPEIFILVNYGIEDKHYSWSGAPFESVLLPKDRLLHFDPSIQVFATGIMDGSAGRNDYGFDNNPVIEFTRSDAARKMVLRSLSDDFDAAFLQEKMALDHLHEEAIHKIVTDYFYHSLNGFPQGYSDRWDDYVEALMDNGLGEYLSLYERYNID